MQATNIPYVKFNKDGICINPIRGGYMNDGPNRRARREYMQRKSSNKKGKR